MAIDNTKGSAIEDIYGKTVNNYNKETQADRTYAQVNRGSKWTIPAVKGMTIVAHSASGNYLAEDDKSNADESKWKYATKVGGVVATSGTGTKTATWIYDGEDETIDYVAGNDAGYGNKLVVTYPSPYSVTNDGNGATSGTVTDASTYDKNASVTTKANSFVKTDYTFTGWNTDADGSGTAIAAGETFTIAGNTTLYAQWIKGSAETITYVLKTSADASTTASTHLTNLVNETNVGIAAVTDQTKSDRSGKYATSSTEGYGVQFTFDIAEGYTFRPTSISMLLATVSTTDFTFYVKLTDSQGTTLTSNALNTFAKDGELTNVTFPAYNKTFNAGTVTMLVTAVRASDAAGTYRIGKTITISGAVNEGVAVRTKADRNFASYVTTKKLDFASAEGITAYIATNLSGDKVVLSSVDVVPAGTPIIVKTNTKGATVNVPVTTAAASDITENVLSGKAYVKLAAGAGARTLSIAFDDETTGISQIGNGELKIENSVFDLQGRRVAQPTKGLYIMNGKKIFIK